MLLKRLAVQMTGLFLAGAQHFTDHASMHLYPSGIDKQNNRWADEAAMVAFCIPSRLGLLSWKPPLFTGHGAYIDCFLGWQVEIAQRYRS